MQLSPPHPPPSYQIFTRWVCCFTRNTLLTFFFALIRLLQKIMHFKVKQTSFFNLCWSVLTLLFFVYVFLRVLFHSSAIMKLRKALYLHIPIASYLTSHQIMWHNKRIISMAWKLKCVLVFSASEETKFQVDATSIILRNLYNFRNVNKELFRYC